MKQKNTFSIMMLLVFLVLFISLSVFVVADFGRGKEPICPNKSCQIDRVWVKMQEKLISKVTPPPQKEWEIKEVWTESEWKDFNEVYQNVK